MDRHAMASQIDAYRAKAAEYERKAETLGHSNAAIRDYYGRLAQHWRSLALLAEDKATREQSDARAGALMLPR
jgi:hypothetical protein